MKKVLGVILLTVSGCADQPATEDQLRQALNACNIAHFEIRMDWEGMPAWYWSSSDGVNNDELDCVRGELDKVGAAANFVDRDVADVGSD